MKDSKNSITSTKKIFLISLGSVLDIEGGGVRYSRLIGNKWNDLEAISSDWISVGKDLEKAVKKFEAENDLCINL